MTVSVVSVRVHVRATVPPGDSVVGVLPFNCFRVATVKLGVNEHLTLSTSRHEALPFDGRIHDLRVRAGDSPTLGVGNLLAFLVRNASSEPTELDLQLLGQTVDEPRPGEATPAPELGHRLVIGLLAREVTLSTEDHFA